jgi:type I restriction enzyme S subunit
MLYPKLRFSEFTETWEKRFIKQILTIGSGRDYKHLKHGEIPVFGTGGLMSKVDDFLYEGETVCIGRKGTIDKPMYFNGKIWTVDTLFYTHSFNHSNPLFVYYIFNKINWKEYNEASGVPSLSKSTIEKIIVNIPSLPEQQKIASFLSTVDEKINLLKKQLSLLEQYRKGVIQKIFSREIRFKDEEGNEFPEWELITLGECLDYEQPNNYLVDNTEYSDTYPTPVVTAGKTFILGYTNEKNGIFANNLPVIIFDDFTTSSQFVTFPFKAKSSAMKILKAKPLFSVKFLFEALQMIKYEVGGHGRHWISVFSKLEMLIPNELEQQKIASFLSSIDEKIDKNKNQISKMELWKRGLLQQMFV